MLAIYLFCLVVGGGFAILSAFGDIFDSGADLDLDTDFDVGASDVSDALEAGAGAGNAAAIFSLRSLIYSMFGFGATGALLTALGAGAGAPTTLGFSVLAGLVVGGVVGSVLAYLKRSDPRVRPGDDGFVGLSGRVTLPIQAASPGRIVVLRGDREHTVRALPFGDAADAESRRWEQVLVVEMRDGVAYVDAIGDEATELLGRGP